MNLTEDLIREIVKQALVEAGQAKASCCSDFVKIKDPSGIIKVATDTVKCERFEQDGVALLTYDEYDIVLEGELEIEIDGRVLSAKQGEIIYIPKNSHIHFQTPSTTKYVYVTYPADWQ